MLRSAKRNMLTIGAAFLACGVLHVALWGIVFLDLFSQLFCGSVAISWGISVKKRVTDRRLNHLMMAIVFFQLLYLVLQAARYSFFVDNLTVSRYLWYAFYLPMEAFPALCFCLAMLIHQPAERRVPPVCWLVFAIAGVLILLMLTNDLHFWAKSFPDGLLDDNGNEKSEWLYYVISAYTYSTYFASFGILLKKSRLYLDQKYRWLPLAPLLVGILYFALYTLDIGHRLLGVRLWNIGEVLVFCLIAALEACIQSGLIPANTDYEKMFVLSNFPAAILDSRGNLKFKTAAAQYPFPDSPSLQIRHHPISGGQVLWAVDIAQLQQLNRELTEATQSIDARNAYLSEETKIKEEKAALETRNRIYDDITRIVRPQLDRISDRMDDPETPFGDRLKKIAVLSAYIKRRSNMELLAENGSLPSEELSLALRESLDYIKLCGVDAALSSAGSERYPAAMVIAAYEQIEAVLEDCLDTLSELMIALKAEPGRITARIMLNTARLSFPTAETDISGSGFSKTYSVTKDNQDMILAFVFSEGGAAS